MVTKTFQILKTLIKVLHSFSSMLTATMTDNILELFSEFSLVSFLILLHVVSCSLLNIIQELAK